MVSKSQINRSGEILRLALLDRYSSGEDDQLAALLFVEEFRRGFSLPLAKVNNGLRSFASEFSPDTLVTQRLKRLPQIIHKLNRLEKTQLARMEDIGGCRVVLINQDQVEAIVKKILRNWNVVREPRNYVSEPKASGYRAIHIVMTRDEHRLEVQLRTRGQQSWANLVEELASAYGLPLKDDKGPREILTWLRLEAANIAYRERQETPPIGFSKSLFEAEAVAVEWRKKEDEK